MRLPPMLSVAVLGAALLFAARTTSAQCTGTIDGTVHDRFGRPLQHALVTVEGTGGLELPASVKSDTNGAYRIDLLALGFHRVSITRFGFAPYRTWAFVAPLRTVRLSSVMTIGGLAINGTYTPSAGRISLSYVLTDTLVRAVHITIRRIDDPLAFMADATRARALDRIDSIDAHARQAAHGMPTNATPTSATLTNTAPTNTTPSVISDTAMYDPAVYGMRSAALPPVPSGTIVNEWDEPLFVETSDAPYRGDRFGQRSLNFFRYGWPRQTLTVPLPAVPGVYVAEISTSTTTQYSAFVVSNIRALVTPTPDEAVVYIVDAATGRRAANVPLACIYESRRIVDGRTDSNGLAHFRAFGSGDSLDTPVMIVGTDVSAVVLSTFALPNESPVTMAYLYTERPVYRPRQTVYYRGILRDRIGARIVRTNDSIVVTQMIGPEGSAIAEDSLRITALGTYHGSFELPEGSAPGEYELTARGQNNAFDWETQQCSFAVDEYKKAELIASITPERPSFPVAAPVAAVVHAQYYFGAPAVDAEVRWYIRRRAPNPRDDDFAFDAQAEIIGTVVASGTAVCDSNGRVTLTFTPEPDDSTESLYSFGVTVTDRSRRTITAATYVRSYRVPYAIGAVLDRNYYHRGATLPITVTLRRFDDADPHTTPVVVDVARVWYNAVPRLGIFRQTVHIWSDTCHVDSAGNATVQFTPTGGGMFTVVARDTARPTSSDPLTTYVTGPELDDVIAAGGSNGARLLAEFERPYSVGDTVHALLLTPTPGGDAFVTASGARIDTSMIVRVERSAMELSIPVTPALSPSMTLTAMTVRDGLPLRASTWISVRPYKRTLTLSIEGDRTGYGPGDSAVITVRVVDEDGHPVNGADIGLAFVDQALDGVAASGRPPVTSISSFHVQSPNTTLADLRSLWYGRNWDLVLRARGRSIPDRRTMAPRGSSLVEWPGNGYIRLQSGVTTQGINGFTIRSGRTFATGFSVDGVEVDDPFTGGFGNTSTELYPGGERVGVEHLVSSGYSAENGDVLSGGEYSTRTTVVGAVAFARIGYDDRDGRTLSGTFNYRPAALREDFRDLMWWEPMMITGADGRATVRVRFPDNITTWRATAIAVDSTTRAGEATAEFAARREIMVRLETPRYATRGDTVTIAATVHNYIDDSVSLAVTLSGTGAVVIGEDTTVMVAPGRDVRIDRRVAAGAADSVVLVASALGAKESDAARGIFPLVPRGLRSTTIATADIAAGDSSATMTLMIPPESDTATRSITISVAPSLASTLVGALDGLAGYPYGCTEQTMSRFVPAVVLADAFTRMGMPFDSARRRELRAMIRAGIAHLGGLQQDDGGWGWWKDGGPDVFMTAYAMYGLAIARQSGYPVPEDMYISGRTALLDLISYAEDMPDGPDDATTLAYLLRVGSMLRLDTLDRDDSTLIDQAALLAQRGDLTPYAIALLATGAHERGDTLAARALVARLESTAISNGGYARWHVEHPAHRWQTDEREMTAAAVEALLLCGGNRSLADRATAWLAGACVGNGYGSTRRTAMVIYALARTLRGPSTKTVPSTMIVSINGRPARTLDVSQTSAWEPDMRITLRGAEIPAGPVTIGIARSGNATPHIVAAATTYAGDDRVRPDASGMEVHREYFLLKRTSGRSGSTHEKVLLDGTVAPGDELLVKVTVRPANGEDYFMLEDPIPAGFEAVREDEEYVIEGEATARDEAAMDDTDDDEAMDEESPLVREFHDDRVAWFLDHITPHDRVFSYIVRAQVPGRIAVMPTVASLCYFTEVNGHGAAETLVVR